MEAGQIGAALLQGLATTNDMIREHRRESAARWRELDQKIDHNHETVLTRLREVCDKGGLEHQGFRDEDSDLRTLVTNLTHRMDLQEARSTGRADILKPALEWAGKNWAVLVLAGIFAFQQYIVPMVARATQPDLTIHGRL